MTVLLIAASYTDHSSPFFLTLNSTHTVRCSLRTPSCPSPNWQHVLDASPRHGPPPLIYEQDEFSLDNIPQHLPFDPLFLQRYGSDQSLLHFTNGDRSARTLVRRITYHSCRTHTVRHSPPFLSPFSNRSPSAISPFPRRLLPPGGQFSDRNTQNPPHDHHKRIFFKAYSLTPTQPLLRVVGLVLLK